VKGEREAKSAKNKYVWKEEWARGEHPEKSGGEEET